MAQINEADLIITPKGNIYHLDIAPENLAKTIITVGDPGRVGEVSKHFDKVTFQASHREFITHSGYIGNKFLSVISTGIGPDNIDIVFNELDALVNIDFATRTIKDKKTQLNIIRLGTCGALQADIPLDSIVVSSHGLGLDNLMHYYRQQPNDEEQFILSEFCNHTGLTSSRNINPYLFEGPISLRKHFGKGFYHGITVTCPGFYGPQGRVLRAPVAFPNLIDALTTFRCGDKRIANFEMETSAMYGMGKMFGHKALSISAVVANRAAKTFSKNGSAAVSNMIERSLEVIVDSISA